MEYCKNGCMNGRHQCNDQFEDCPNACGKPVECGSTCCLNKDHSGECECSCDTPGEPGTCPA
jgi:hypothetical protein